MNILLKKFGKLEGLSLIENEESYHLVNGDDCEIEDVPTDILVTSVTTEDGKAVSLISDLDSTKNYCIIVTDMENGISTRYNNLTKYENV